MNQLKSIYLPKLKSQRVREKNLNGQSRERERKEDAVKEEISGEPIRKPVFKIKRPKRKKKIER